ncbi:hypothetical protein ACFQL1_15060 [Halomicroarcula sp. GCM10025709]|nr:hypothetical protein [Halomicroarcula sp. YJ-61-S]
MFVQIDRGAAIILGIALVAVAAAVIAPEATGATIDSAVTAVQSTAEGIA